MKGVTAYDDGDDDEFGLWLRRSQSKNCLKQEPNKGLPDISYPNLFVLRRFVPWLSLTLTLTLTLTSNSNTNT